MEFVVEISRPTPHRLNQLAITAVEQASEAAFKEPIQAGPGVRLALAWLSLNRVVPEQEIADFWLNLTKPARPGDADGYCRSRDLTVFVNRCKHLSGVRRR
ncbi:hypothetical protein A8V01_14615 [Novosphingobium guangzhouense]|uniref:Uncharacterized protein n=1 Tax=Novosphingobium guangzhouense TaxID=1850347 RepID=A0A2K2G445_9SPHN|nr:hypothetical protein A8V01_14615 [Novosphingobium guangzhouense]